MNVKMSCKVRLLNYLYTSYNIELCNADFIFVMTENIFFKIVFVSVPFLFQIKILVPLTAVQ